jgi:hypothetical protein
MRLHWNDRAPVAQGIERCPAEAEVACSNHAGRIDRARSGAGPPNTNPDGAQLDTNPFDTQGKLSHPAGLVVGPDDALYVSNFSTAPSFGEVLRIEP